MKPILSNLKEIKFNRNELAGAFGDIGTDLPLIISMILIANLNSSSVLIVFGSMQIATALIYRVPMPVQPLKAMAAIVITQKIQGNILYAGGLAIGVTMLLLTVTGLIDWIAKVIPKCVIRGIQFGLGIKLAILALSNYIPSDGIPGYWLAAISFLIIVFLFKNKKIPPAVFVIILGVIYGFTFKINTSDVIASFGFSIPEFNVPQAHDILTGFVLLTLPQIPLSLGNSILATKQIHEDLFPDNKPLSVRKISFTYSIINIISPFLSGIPICHGSGGMAGHYTFGGRTGGSVIIYGLIYIITGFLFSSGFDKMLLIFPLPVLGVLLFFEGLALMVLIRDLTRSTTELTIAVIVALIAAALPYGFVIGLVAGTLLYYLSKGGFTNFKDDV